MLREQARVGMKVIFGRNNGEKTLGEIIKINPTKAKVKALEERGNGRGSAVGTTWVVPYSLLTPADNTGGKSVADETSDIVVGVTKFNSTYADSNPEWIVLRKEGRNYLCCVTEESMDWEGTEKVFRPEEILQSLRFTENFKKTMDENERFYNNLQLGQVVHYYHGFKCWIRCVVVTDEGKKKLKPTALLGDWKPFDLSRRNNGVVVDSYHVECIRNEELMTPHISNIYEATPNLGKREGSPIGLMPVDISVPPITDEEKRIVPLWETVERIRSILNSEEVKPTRINDGLEDPTPLLEAVKSLLKV